MYDCIVIGGGPGGFVCGLHLAKHNARVAVVEKSRVGGCCTNQGCIPTKALYAAAEIIDTVSGSRRFGINAEYTLDYAALLKEKERIVEAGRKGIISTMRTHNIELIEGTGRIIDKNTVEVNNKLATKNIVIATGSLSSGLPNIEFNHENIIDSADMLNLAHLPKTLLIIGAGSVGVEFAGIFSKFGVKVTLVEMMPNILPGMDRELSAALEQAMRKNGIDVRTDAAVTGIENGRAHIKSKDTEYDIHADKILIATGRRPYFNKEEMDKLGIGYEKGIPVDDFMETRVRGIYAVGDVTARFMLAHAAMMQGTVAAENIMGKNVRMDYSAIPQVVFSFPQLASVGTSSGRSFTLPFSANSRALCENRRTGFVKVVAEQDVIVGVHIFGQHAAELIGEGALAVRNKLKLSDVLRTVHAHPTYAEAFFECARALLSVVPNQNKKSPL